MEPGYFEKLAPSNAPEAWLAVMSPGREDYVVAVAGSEKELDILQLKKDKVNWINLGHDIVAVKDSPSLRVQYQGGFWWNDEDPAQLAARKNWFLRYQAILEKHLKDPLPALVQFYKRGRPDDLLCTMRSTKSGPFPFPKGADWPRCRHCLERMAFVGVLDFRDYHRIGQAAIPDGSLVLHGCNECSIPCLDNESTSLKWLTPDQQIELQGTSGAGEDVELGVTWETMEFPTPAFYPEELSADPAFLKEDSIYEYFACPLNKVGGHLRWIQGDYTPTDRKGNPMKYIGQFTGTKDVELGDAGILYLFFSDETGETDSVLQYY
jgi:hypothetical protein